MSISLAEINVNHGGDYLAEFVAENELDKPAFVALKPRDLRNRPKRRELIAGMMYANSLNMMFAEAGVGKTVVALDMTACLISGQTFAGEFPIYEPLHVVYACGEGIDGISARLDAIFEARGVLPADEDRLTIFDSVPQLFKPAGNGAAELVRDIQAQGVAADLLIIDTFHSATYGSDENGTKDAGVNLAALKHIQSQLNCAVLVIHHTSKAGELERGNTAYRGASDNMYRIGRAGTQLVLQSSKAKDMAPFPEQAFSLIAKRESVIPLWHGKAERKAGGNKKADIAKIVFTLAENPGIRLTAKSISEAIGQSASYTNELLQDARESAGVKRELLDSAKDSSNRNPWVYFIESEAQDWVAEDGIKPPDGMDW